MASEVQNGHLFSISCNFCSNEFFLKISFAFCLCWKWEKIVKEVFSFWLKMAPLAQGVGQKLFFCHNFGSIQKIFNLFFALVLCYQHANLMEEKF
jgi:hypothetical protein